MIFFDLLCQLNIHFKLYSLYIVPTVVNRVRNFVTQWIECRVNLLLMRFLFIAADTWSGSISPSSWSKHDPAIISINSSNSVNAGSTTTSGGVPAGGIAGGLLDKDSEEQPPHWLESLQTLTEPEESPTHSNHLFPSHQHNNRGMFNQISDMIKQNESHMWALVKNEFKM